MPRFGWTVVFLAACLAAALGLILGYAGLNLLRALFVGVNVATLLAYGYDKGAAQRGGQRVPEAALHLLAAVGGTPGAFVGQWVFRHKTRDRQFQWVFWSIAVVQVILLLAIPR